MKRKKREKRAKEKNSLRIVFEKLEKDKHSCFCVRRSGQRGDIFEGDQSVCGRTRSRGCLASRQEP